MKTSFALIAIYQYRENYGSHTWDGEGDCPQHWKNKGAHEEVIHPGMTGEVVNRLGDDGLEKLVETSEKGFGRFNDYTEYVFLDWTLVALSEQLVEEVRTFMETDNDHDPYWVSLELDITEYEAQWALEQIKGATS